MSPDEFGPPEPIAPSTADLLQRYRTLAATPMTPEETAAELAKAAPQTSALKAFDVASVKGVPVLGALTTKGDAAADAALDVLKGAITSPENVAGEHDKGMMEFLRNQYQRHLKERQGQEAQLEAEHPDATSWGHTAGNVAGFAALPAASMASLPAAMATTGGVSALDAAARGAAPQEALGAGLGGAAGGAFGYGTGKVLSKALGKLADWQAIRAMGGTTSPGFQGISNVAGNLGLGPGGLAALGREQGIVGGLKKLPDVAEAAGAAREQVGERFGGLIKAADESGSLIPVDDIINRVKDAAPRGVRPKYLESALKEAKDELGEMAGPGGKLTHGQLQEWLSQRAEQASGISGDMAKKANVSAPDRAFHAVYKAGRNVQDAALTDALGETGAGAKELRRLLALNSVTERVAQNRGQMLAAQNPVGLIGSMGALEGVHQLLGGNVAGLPILALSLGAKATQPYRANLLTTALSAGQGGLERATAAGIPAIVGSKAGASVGGYLAKKKPEDEFGPPEPIQVAGGKP